MRSEQDILQDLVANFSKVGEYQYKIRQNVTIIESLYRKIDEYSIEYANLKNPEPKADDKLENKE